MLTLLEALESHAVRTPTKPALLVACAEEWQQFSYRDLLAETEAWAAVWAATNAAPGRVVFLILQHCPQMYPAFLGALRAGLIPSLMPFPTPKQDPDIYWRDHEELFRRVTPACVLTYAALAEAVRAIADPVGCAVLDAATACSSQAAELPALPDRENPTRVAVLQHSSGTTGLKKGVALTYQQIRDQVEACTEAAGISAADRIITWLPIYHDMGLIAAFLLPITAGATIISIDAFDWLKRPDMFLDEIARFRATACWLPNFAFNHLVRTRDRDRGYDLSSLRLVIDCSEPCRPESVDMFIKAFRSHGLRPEAVQVSYGMAEAVFAVTHTSPGTCPRSIAIDRIALAERSEIVLAQEGAAGSTRLLSCGVPLAGMAIRIRPGERQPTAAGAGHGVASVGEVELRCDYLFDGYYGNRAETQAVFDGTWLKTGDMGFFLDGELFICGRKKEMLIIHGRNFYANDIEALVNRLDGIKPGRVVAVGVFDPIAGSEEAVILAESTLTSPEARHELDTAIRKRLFDILGLSVRRVELAGEGTLVKTTSGKISRGENLRRLNTEAALT